MIGSIIIYVGLIVILAEVTWGIIEEDRMYKHWRNKK